MIPWLLVTELMSRSRKKLSQLVGERIQAYPCSGEINYRVANVPQTIGRVLQHFQSKNPIIDLTDGVSVEFPEWRFNLRGSNTEPLLRLNVETKGEPALVKIHLDEIEKLLSEEA